MADLSQALAKIRPHVASSLAHQKAPAILLQALESTFQEKNTEKSPTAYYAALLTTLDSTLQSQSSSGFLFGEGDVLPAELYLLSLVVPFVPQPVLRSNLATVLSLTAPIFPALVPHAPPLRSQLTIYNSIFLALDRSQLDVQGVRQSFASVLHLCLDPRPKVRKKAADLVRDVLAGPPTPLTQHPYAEQVADFITFNLSEIGTGAVFKGKGKESSVDSTETGIHLLTLVGPLILTLPPSSLPSIASHLLSFPRLGNPYLSRSTFSVLSQVISASIDEDNEKITSRLPEIIAAIHSSSPISTDTTQSSAWMLVLANAVVTYNSIDPSGCEGELGKFWKSIWVFLESADSPTRKSAAEALDMMSKCFTDSLIKLAIQDHEKSTLGKIISQCQKALDSLSFARSFSELLFVISSIISRLRYRSGPRGSPTAAEILMASIIQKVGDLRMQKNFEYKEAADAALSSAIRVLGPQSFLRLLPLNLEPADRNAGLEPRAFVLPLLAQPHTAPLGHFISYFVPLTERMFDLQQKAEADGRASEAKVWSVLIAQIWTGLPGYCYGSSDLQQALTPSFSKLLSQLVYSQNELRPPILKALRIMVDSNVALASREDSKLKKLPPSALEDPISSSEAAANVNFLKTQVESWLAVLFNVFGTVDRDNRSKIGDVISAWAGIAGEEIRKAYTKIVELFKQNLSKSKNSKSIGTSVDGNGGVTAMTQDLLLLLLPFFPSVDSQALFELCISPQVLEDKHTDVQKRGYKTLGKLIESGKVTLDAETVIRQLESAADSLTAAAKKDRLHLLTLLVNIIPNNALHLIPSLIPEAVLGAKEPSEKARLEAFELVVSMGRKMKQGGVVRLSLLSDMEQDDTPEAAANLEEYLKMVAGGLAGASPHMISATITAVSRLVFEFKDDLSPQMLDEIFTTSLVFLESANREIVKSALGFVKLAIHMYPTDIIQQHLSQLIKCLLSWSHGHRNHFKLKVRYICERMIRKFGFEVVYSCVEDNEDGKKVLMNIKKRREHAKKKKQSTAEDLDEDANPSSKPATGAAFEDVLYGSESEGTDSEDDEGVPDKSLASGARLRADNDEPMDLLEGAATLVTNAKSNRRRKPGRDARRFKTDVDSGKMVIDDDDQDDVNDNGSGTVPPEEDVVGTAYRESIQSVDGFTRGANGRIKFNKDTKKRRRENAEDEDVEMIDTTHHGKKAKRKPQEKLGKEFKAKKAGGDVKKGGLDPYAYVTLQQAAKKKSGRITNKR